MTTPRKLELIRAVVNAYAERGDLFTFTDVATRMGVAQQSVFYYFPNKKAIKEAAIEYAAENSEEPDCQRVLLFAALDHATADRIPTELALTAWKGFISQKVS